MSIRLVKKEQMANDIWVLIPHHTVLLKYQNKFKVQQGWFNHLQSAEANIQGKLALQSSWLLSHPRLEVVLK